MEDLLLYHYPLSRSVRVRWLLNEMGVEYDVKTLKIFRGEARTEEFLQMNPNHAVPVVEFTCKNEGKRHAMFESSALVRFFAENSDQLPKKAANTSDAIAGLEPIPHVSRGWSVREVAEFEQWYSFASTTADGVLWNLRVINDFRAAPSEEKSILQFNIDKWNDIILPQIEARFADGREYIMKQGFTIADVILYHDLTWAGKYRFLNPISPALKAYHKRMKSRPALRDATTDGHLFEADAKI